LQRLSDFIRGNDLIVAPVALNPIMARLAEEAGFKAVYMSGGSLGWYKCVTEANITLPEMAQVALDMRAACQLPIVLDAGGGWGDPMHINRTIALAQAAGFAAIEIEDQLLPRRVAHHVGIEHLVPRPNSWSTRSRRQLLRAPTPISSLSPAPMHGAFMASTTHCGAVKRSPKPAPTWFSCSRANADEMRTVGERLPAPLMIFAPPDGFAEFALNQRDLATLGFRLAASSGTAFAAMVKAVRQSYECLAQSKIDPFLARGEIEREMKAAMTTAGLDRLLEIERRTMKD
jgi:methylisocitrate lyase